MTFDQLEVLVTLAHPMELEALKKLRRTGGAFNIDLGHKDEWNRFYHLVEEFFSKCPTAYEGKLDYWLWSRIDPVLSIAYQSSIETIWEAYISYTDTIQNET